LSGCRGPRLQLLPATEGGGGGGGALFVGCDVARMGLEMVMRDGVSFDVGLVVVIVVRVALDLVRNGGAPPH
jgi:hypothetical protein